MRGRDWEHLDVPHLGFASCPSGRRDHTVLVVFSAANPASSRNIPAAYRGNPEFEAMVMTPDTPASRRTRDPETDPRPFFESSSKRSGRDVPPRSRCSLLLVLFYSSPLLFLLPSPFFLPFLLPVPLGAVAVELRTAVAETFFFIAQRVRVIAYIERNGRD